MVFSIKPAGGKNGRWKHIVQECTLTYCNSPVRNLSTYLTATFLGFHPGTAAGAADSPLMSPTPGHQVCDIHSSMVSNASDCHERHLPLRYTQGCTELSPPPISPSDIPRLTATVASVRLRSHHCRSCPGEPGYVQPMWLSTCPQPSRLHRPQVGAGSSSFQPKHHRQVSSFSDKRLW